MRILLTDAELMDNRTKAGKEYAELCEGVGYINPITHMRLIQEITAKAQVIKLLNELKKNFIHDSEHKFHYLLPVEYIIEITKELDSK